jgi:hypothetical protein
MLNVHGIFVLFIFAGEYIEYLLWRRISPNPVLVLSSNDLRERWFWRHVEGRGYTAGGCAKVFNYVIKSHL